MSEDRSAHVSQEGWKAVCSSDVGVLEDENLIGEDRSCLDVVLGSRC